MTRHDFSIVRQEEQINFFEVEIFPKIQFPLPPKIDVIYIFKPQFPKLLYNMLHDEHEDKVSLRLIKHSDPGTAQGI